MVAKTRKPVSKKLRNACLLWLRKYGRVDDATKRIVERGLQQAWDSGEPYLQYAALQFIADTGSPMGQPVLARALKSKQPSMVGNAQSAAFTLAYHKQEFQAPLIEALEHVVDRGFLESERWFALQVLGSTRQASEWIEAYFERGPSAEFRLNAARILLKGGSPIGRELLLDTLRSDTTGLLVADEVWTRRDILRLSPAEERVARKAVRRYIASHRRRLHAKASSHYARYQAARVMRALASDGFPLTPRDKKAVRRALARRPDDLLTE